MRLVCMDQQLDLREQSFSRIIPIEITLSIEPGHVEPCWGPQGCQFLVVSLNIWFSIIVERSIPIDQQESHRSGDGWTITLVVGHVAART